MQTTRAVAAPLALALLAGCSNPFRTVESDYGDVSPPERFRDITPFPIDQHAKPPPQTDDPIAAARARLANLESVDLTLEEARVAALENNLDLQVALIDPAIAAEFVSEEEARFDSSFTLNGFWSQTDTPTSTELDASAAEFGSLEPGVVIPLRSGGTATVSLPMSRSSTDNEFATLPTSYTSDLEFSFSQPLLRNAGRRITTAGIRIASYNRQAGEARTRLAVINQLTAIDRVYWRVYQARRNLEVTQQQYELATAQYDRAKRRHGAGVVPEIEVIRAESGLAERLELIIVAQNEILTLQRELKRLINRPGIELDTGIMIIPTTPPDPVHYEFDRVALAYEAMDSRAELIETEFELLADATNVELARDSLLPQLDATATYRINGLGADASDSFEVLGENNFEDWSIGFTASVPFGNDAAESRVRRSLLSRLQRLGSRESRRQTVRQEVYDAADRIEAGWQRILASRQSVRVNTRALESEQRQFDVGKSTSTDVLDAAANLAQAQFSEIRALTEYQIAQIDLAAATGTLLGAAKVRWEPHEPPSHKDPTPNEWPAEATPIVEEPVSEPGQ